MRKGAFITCFVFPGMRLPRDGREWEKMGSRGRCVEAVRVTLCSQIPLLLSWVALQLQNVLGLSLVDGNES